nr:PAS domain S-box protein [Candidatus Omnitrophota bacterium]
MKINSYNFRLMLIFSYIIIISIIFVFSTFLNNVLLGLFIALALSFIFVYKISINSRNELDKIAYTLNKMAKKLEDKINEIEIKNQHLVAILESMVEGIIVVDKTSHIVSVNPTVENIFNISKKNLEGKIFLEVIRNNDISDIISAVLKKGEFTSCELTLMWPVQKIFQINASPVFEKGIVSGCLLVIHDMTEIRKLETMRRDFVANVSHELKTPLTSIKGFLETLLEGALDDKENNRRFLIIMQNHTERLNKLVDDLLSLSHLESKEMLLRKKLFNLYQQVVKVITNCGTQLKKRDMEIRNELPINLSVNADKDKIEGVMTNLIDNAIKFNKEKGAIRIYSQDQNDNIKIIIEDTGVGIPEKDIPRIFERFYRVDKARSTELGGTGLGLSIVKHIVELHGGEVGVESVEGLGSKFWFTLPKQ